MASFRTYKTHGVVLKQTPLGEADRILTLCTHDRGKVRAVGSGVRRTKSRLAGHLEPLTHVRVSVAEGRDLHHVIEAETVHSFRALREDLDRMSVAVYLCELTDSFTAEGAPSPEVLDLLLATMRLLESGETSPMLVHAFEVKVLGHSGFGPEVQRCVDCRSDLEPGDHLYSSSAGGTLCPACRVRSEDAMVSVSMNAIKVLRFLQREDLGRGASLSVSAALAGEIERLMSIYIKYVLERELKSTEFMKLVAATGGRS